MTEKAEVALAQEPMAEQVLSLDGDVVSTLAGAGVLDIVYHALDFVENQNPANPNWVSRSKTITPPQGWRRVLVSVAQWDIDFYPRERPLTYLGFRAGVRLNGNTLEITAYAICRDINADDPWRGKVTVQVIFLG
ncbi:MAG: hypothetical protein U1A77_23155 [Pirellulales bacterium]